MQNSLLTVLSISKCPSRWTKGTCSPLCRGGSSRRRCTPALGFTQRETPLGYILLVTKQAKVFHKCTC